MIIKTTKIDLIRETQTFQAGIALIKGTLADAQQLVHQLHPQESTIYQSYRHGRRKKSYLLGRVAAKQAISKLHPTVKPETIWLDSGVFTFPIVKSKHFSNIQVSISHCDDFGFSVAFPEAHPMGVDIERINQDRIAAILSQITEKEKLLLQNHFGNTIANSTALFSVKEALSKVLRTGMMLDFKFLEIDTVENEGPIIEYTFAHFGQYKAFALIKNDYVFSLVLPKRTSVQLASFWQKIATINTIANEN